MNVTIHGANRNPFAIAIIILCDISEFYFARNKKKKSYIAHLGSLLRLFYKYYSYFFIVFFLRNTILSEIVLIHQLYQAAFSQQISKGVSMPAAKGSSRVGRNKRKPQRAVQNKPLPAAKVTVIENKMAIYGIRRVPVDYFHYGPYRYTNLNDALAQAKKDIG